MSCNIRFKEEGPIYNIYYYLFWFFSALQVSPSRSDFFGRVQELLDVWFAQDVFGTSSRCWKEKRSDLLYIFIYFGSLYLWVSLSRCDFFGRVWESSEVQFAPDLFWTSSWREERGRSDLSYIFILFWFSLPFEYHQGCVILLLDFGSRAMAGSLQTGFELHHDV
jgi:hypothetical protein